MYKAYNPILCGKESYHAAHRSVEFHRERRNLQRYFERRAFRATMKAVHSSEAEKVTPFKIKATDAQQRKILDSIQRAAEARERAMAQREVERRVRNLGRTANAYRV